MKKQADLKYKENINNGNTSSTDRQNIQIKINGTSIITETHK